MANGTGTRIQLCGRLVVEIGGRRVEEKLPGRQSRVLFAYLAVNRSRRATRGELADALWPEGAPDAAELGVAPGRAAQELYRRLLEQVDAVRPTG